MHTNFEIDPKERTQMSVYPGIVMGLRYVCVLAGMQWRRQAIAMFVTSESGH